VLNWDNVLGIRVVNIIDPGLVLSIDPNNRALADSGANNSVDWELRTLIKSDSTVVVDWENGIGIIDAAFIDQTNRWLIDSGTNISVDWENRQLFASDGTTVVLNFSAQQPSSGAQTAGAVYTATEQTMLQEAYDALLAYGLLAP